MRNVYCCLESFGMYGRNKPNEPVAVFPTVKLSTEFTVQKISPLGFTTLRVQLLNSAQHSYQKCTSKIAPVLPKIISLNIN
jgi:hypothetical protein